MKANLQWVVRQGRGGNWIGVCEPLFSISRQADDEAVGILPRRQGGSDSRG